MKVLVADDEAGIRLLVGALLEEAGHEPLLCDGGEEALAAFFNGRPDIVILDIMMPKVDGYEVCRRIREADERVPVLFLSAKGDIVDKKIGFTTGADDYLVKPFNDEELLMRVEALARRVRIAEDRPAADAERFILGDFEFDAIKHQITHRGSIVSLTPKEFQLLLHLAMHHGAVMSKEELIENVWGEEYVDEGIGIAVYIRKIREKIEDDPAKPKHLKTVWGVGYAFEG